MAAWFHKAAGGFAAKRPSPWSFAKELSARHWARQRSDTRRQNGNDYVQVNANR